MNEKMVNIGQAAKLSQVSAKTIRYYEEIGLIGAAKRQENGYRFYDNSSLAELSLVKGARDAGFNLEQCKELMQLFRDKSRQSSEVKALTLQKITQMEAKISALKLIVENLQQLSLECVGDESPDCAILDGLSK